MLKDFQFNFGKLVNIELVVKALHYTHTAKDATTKITNTCNAPEACAVILSFKFTCQSKTQDRIKLFTTFEWLRNFFVIIRLEHFNQSIMLSIYPFIDCPVFLEIYSPE